MPTRLARRARRVDARDPVNRPHPLNRGRAAWWLALPHNSGGATWYDLMGLNPGVFTSMGNTSNGWRNAPARPGSLGPGVLTDGTAGAVNCGAPAGLNSAAQAAYAGWVYKPSNSTTAGLGGSSGVSGGNNRFSFNWFTDGTGYFAAESSALAYGTCTIPVGWNRVFCCFDGAGAGNAGRLQVFLGGVPQALTFSGTIGTAIGTVSPFTIGRDSSDRPAAGQYDDVALWLGLSGASAPAFAAMDYDQSRRGYPDALNYT